MIKTNSIYEILSLEEKQYKIYPSYLTDFFDISSEYINKYTENIYFNKLKFDNYLNSKN